MTDPGTEQDGYEPPEVVDLGPVEALTQGPNGTTPDGNEGTTAPVSL
jgi:hypothetical protein